MSYRKDVRDFSDDAVWTFWKFLGTILVPVAFISLLLFFVSILWSTPMGVVNKVINPDAIVTNYEWFESQYQDIQAADAQIVTAEKSVDRFKEEAGPRDTWKFNDREEFARLNENLDGLRLYLSKLVGDYNANARKITRNLWKRGDLPNHIN